jgi:hypothetical protein
LDWLAQDLDAVDVRSDRLGEFDERGRDAPMGSTVAPEFVVAAPNVLHERVAADDHAGGAVAFESTHRSEPVGAENSSGHPEQAFRAT